MEEPRSRLLQLDGREWLWLPLLRRLVCHFGHLDFIFFFADVEEELRRRMIEEVAPLPSKCYEDFLVLLTAEPLDSDCNVPKVFCLECPYLFVAIYDESESRVLTGSIADQGIAQLWN